MAIRYKTIRVNAEIVEFWQMIMRKDKNYPVYNDGIQVTFCLDLVAEIWNGVKNQKSPDRYVRFYEQYMKRIKKLQKQGMIDMDARQIRTLEEVKNAT